MEKLSFDKVMMEFIEFREQSVIHFDFNCCKCQTIQM